LLVLVLLVWIGAVVVAAVVLAFCGYELSWKSRRLRTDLQKLTALSEQLGEMQHEVAAMQRRMNEARA
jgi:outer membrane murein-binding lipoprotein Lpp